MSAACSTVVASLAAKAAGIPENPKTRPANLPANSGAVPMVERTAIASLEIVRLAALSGV